jgi:hypothetical protein
MNGSEQAAKRKEAEHRVKPHAFHAEGSVTSFTEEEYRKLVRESETNMPW